MVVKSLNSSFVLLEDFVSGLTSDSFVDQFCNIGATSTSGETRKCPRAVSLAYLNGGN